MKLEISNAEQAAYLFCDFCATEYRWPFLAQLTLPKNEQPIHAFPDAKQVINSHWFDDSDRMVQFKFPRCPRVNRWEDVLWEVIDRDHGVKVSVGRVLIQDGRPYVVGPVSFAVVCRACTTLRWIESADDAAELARVFSKDGFRGRADDSVGLWCGECHKEYEEIVARGSFTSPDRFEAERREQRESGR